MNCPRHTSLRAKAAMLMAAVAGVGAAAAAAMNAGDSAKTPPHPIVTRSTGHAPKDWGTSHECRKMRLKNKRKGYTRV